MPQPPLTPSLHHWTNNSNSTSVPSTELKPLRTSGGGGGGVNTPTLAARTAQEAPTLPSFPYSTFDTPSSFSTTPLRPVQDLSAISAAGTHLGYHTVSPLGAAQTPVKPLQSLALGSTASLAAAAHAATTDGPATTMSHAAMPSSTSTSESLQRITGQAEPPRPTTGKSKAAMSHAEANAALQNSGGAVPTVYLATYSNVPVYEITVRGIAVMRRRNDGWLNATSILKIAGIEKTKRTKILEKNILTGLHEKIQGGYGKFQGTWIPLERAQELAAEHNVAHILKPILEFDPATAGQLPKLYQRRKPQPSARNTSSSAINDGRASGTPTSSKTYSPAPMAGGAAGPSQQPRFLSLRPPKEVEARSMSPALFMPPGGGGLLNATGSAMSPAGSSAIPPGSSQAEQDALRSYTTYGYIPQGVPLPAAESSATGLKRLGPSDSGHHDDGQAKRVRVTSPDKGANGSSGLGAGLSPVKDLNALGPLGGSFRAASAPRGNRMALGTPEARALEGTVPRYADRAIPPKPYDEGEKRMRDHLVGLFAEEDAINKPKGSQATPSQNGSAAPTGAAPASAPAPAPVPAPAPAAGVNTANAKPATATAEERSDAKKGEQADSDQIKLDNLLKDLKEKASLGGLGGGSGSEGPRPTLDLVTDDHGHTALHWASALCRLPLVRILTARPHWEGGANIHAGNHAGETALHRSVLVTNSYDASSFPALLQLLAPSLNTRDFKKRTVLHHVALVAGLKGRAASARYYMACVLEHISGDKSSRYNGLVDAQDEDGETALGIVARLGNASMVRMLLDVGARKDLPNALGIRPADWGIEAAEATGASAAAASSSSVANLLPLATANELATKTPHDIVAALGRPSPGPVLKSSDVREQMTSALDDLQIAFERELKSKQEAVDVVQGHLQAATRDLASRRRNVSAAQARVAEKDEAKQRVRNLRRALSEHLHISPDDDAFVQQSEALIELARQKKERAKAAATTTSNGGDQMDVDGDPSNATASTGTGVGGDDTADGLDLPISTIRSDLEALGSGAAEAGAVEAEELVRLRWMVRWYGTACDELQAEIEGLEGASARKEMQCQQVVAMCANVPQDKVESMLDDLLTAMESDGQDVDLARVANFMQKVGKVSSAPAASRAASAAGGGTAGNAASTGPTTASTSNDAVCEAEPTRSESNATTPPLPPPQAGAKAGDKARPTG